MIFKRYRSLFIVIAALCLLTVAISASKFAGGFPELQGKPQPSGAAYPLTGPDRVLIDLSGEWQAYPSLKAAAVSLAPVVQSEVYSLEKIVYGKEPGAKTVVVPGSWDWPVAVYRFMLSNDLAGKDFRLHFLGTGGRAQVFVNGVTWAESVGFIEEGAAPVSLSIPSPRLKFGQVNTITVKLEKPSVIGEWLRFPGLTGEVYLEALGPIVIEQPQLVNGMTGGGAELSYKIPVSSKSREDVLTGQISVLDKGGDPVAINSFSLKNGPRLAITGKLSVPQARLWSIQDPYLYRLQIVVNGGRGERDSVSLPIGLREVKISAGAVQLNGQKVEPNIIQRVNDSDLSGSASNADQLDKDLNWAKNKGYNIIYLPDSPSHPYLLELADRYGLLVLSQPAGRGFAKPSQDYALSHPAFLAQGLGSGLDITDAKLRQSIEESAKSGPVFYTAQGKQELIFPGWGEVPFKAPFLADFLGARPSFTGSDFAANFLQTKGILSRDRSEKASAASEAAGSALPAVTPLLAAGLTVLMLLPSWSLGNLRFAKLFEPRLKRKNREQVKQQARWYLFRLALLSLIVTDLSLGLRLSPAAGYAVQSIPWRPLQLVVWFILTFPWAMVLLLLGLGILLSLVMAYPRARSLPGKPGGAAFLIWSEKRKRWIALALGAWVYKYYGGPYWLVWAALALGFVLGVRAVGKDVRWAGGKNYYGAYVAAFSGLLIASLLANRELIIYLYHWLGL